MALDVGNVVIDCADPHRLEGFWTRTLGVDVVEDYGICVG